MNRPKKQSSKPVAPTARVVGLDIHPDIFTACLLIGETNRNSRIEKRFRDLPVSGLEAWASQHLTSRDLVLLEASANSFEAVRRLEKLGLKACVLESHQVSKTASGYLDDDLIASERIARSYLTGMSKVVWVPDTKTSEYRELLHAYQKAKKLQTQSINELKSYLNQYHIRLGKRSPRLEKTREWILAQRIWTPLQEVLLRRHFDQLNFACEQAEQLYGLICREVLKDPRMAGCLRLLGIGPVNAFAIVATVGDITRFSSPQKLANYLGLTPGRRESGKGKKINIGIGCRGRKEMRTLLMQGAQAVMRQKQGANELRDWGWRLFMRKGNRNVAVAGVARKLTVQLWHLLKGHGVTLEEQKKSLERKLQKLLRALGKDLRQTMALPKKVSDCVAQIMKQIDEPLPQTT